MIDTRPVMTDAEFAEASGDTFPNWWMTGERLIHVSSVMNVEGWNSYGHPGHLALTPAQRTLMMWSDIVGQVSNGGFIQFCDNYVNALPLAVGAVGSLEWPDLNERFCRAMTEQASDASAPVRRQPVPLEDDPIKWAASRMRLVRHLARRKKRWWQPTTASSLATVHLLNDEAQLQLKYQLAVLSGEMASGGERFFDFDASPSDEAEAFDDWFYSTEAKEASAHYVHRYVMHHRTSFIERTNKIVPADLGNSHSRSLSE